uniref:Uncharacterized protein n=1 Tax=Rhodnius prolixus TaxID=13249 RepID=T1IBE2_RHOPR
MDPVNMALLAILVTIIAYLVHHARKVNQYWKLRNIPHVKPHLFIGNTAPILLRTQTNGETLKLICDRFPNEPIIGYYVFMKPTILINDAEIIEKVLIKDFVHFVDRGFPIDEVRNPLDSNLFAMTGKRWKAVRNRLSPIFTTGKLRLMYDAMADCGNELVTQMEGDQEIDMREILGRFAMDVIGNNLNNDVHIVRTIQESGFQEKVRKEVQREVKNAGSLNYDAVKGMEFLEQCVNETMRKYPPTPMLFRVCTKSYILPNGLIIEPGQPLQISVYSLHYNPSYYPEPEKYKPERFDPDQTVPSCAYIPFGNGPRICIAMRFAMLQMKYCLAKLLLTYKFQVSPKTREPLGYSVKTIFTAPAHPILFNVSKLEVEEKI